MHNATLSPSFYEVEAVVGPNILRKVKRKRRPAWCIFTSWTDPLES